MPHTRNLGFRSCHELKYTLTLVLCKHEFSVSPLGFFDWLGSVIRNFDFFFFYNSRFWSSSATWDLLTFYSLSRIHKSSSRLGPNKLSAFFWVIWYTSTSWFLLLWTRSLASSPNGLIKHLKLRSCFFWNLLNFVLILNFVSWWPRNLHLLLR